MSDHKIIGKVTSDWGIMLIDDDSTGWLYDTIFLNQRWNQLDIKQFNESLEVTGTK